MRIRTQLNTLLALGALMIPVTIGMTMYSVQNVAEKGQDSQATEELIISVTRLRLIAVETALFPEARVQEQWQRKIASVSLELDQKPANTPHEKVNLLRIRENVGLLNLIYPRLVRTAASITSVPDQADIEAAVKARAVASLLVVTQEIMDLGQDLLLENKQDSAAALRLMQVLISLTLLVLGMLFAFVCYLLNKRILRPLRIFDKATQQVAAGNYAHRVRLAQGDEIGELANAFDAMAMRVESTAAELGEHRNFLADLVDSRTAELEKAKERAEFDSQYARSLIEASLDPLVTINTEGKITDVNKATEKVTGKCRDTLIGSDFADNFTNPQKARAGYRQAFAKGFVTDYSLAIHPASGKVTDVLYNASVYRDGKGKVAGVFAAARDVTERRRLDKTLREKNVELQHATTAAEKANLAKSEFLSSMSHELRTPLHAILGFAQLLETDKPPPSAQQTDSLNHIVRAGWHLLELINEVLDLAVVESGKLSLSLEAVPLFEIMQESQAMIELQAMEREIEVSVIPCDNKVCVEADRTRLKQVLVNLLSNAIKYNRKQGTVQVVCTCTPDRVRISVRDTGAGLSAEQLAQLFQPFNRLGQENGLEPGTGIGLVLTKQLVELMDGSVGVTSTVGVGTEFWIELIRTDMNQPCSVMLGLRT